MMKFLVLALFVVGGKHNDAFQEYYNTLQGAAWYLHLDW